MAWGAGSRASRGYGPAWDRLRAAALARDMGLCQSCIRQGRTHSARAVDHIRPRAQGGAALPDLSGLQSLCDPCHAAKGLLETGRTPRPTRGPDGWPLADAPRYVGPLWRQGRPGWAD